MTRGFSATALDLTRVDRTALWPGYSFETIRTARLNDLKSRLTIAGIAFDVEGLESEPGVYLQETGAYREMLTLQAIDDAQASVLLAFAWGEWLDRLGDLQGCARLSGESDARYRLRIQLAVEAYPATGTPGGYIYHAVGVSTDVRDVNLVVHNRGTYDVSIEVSILSATGTGVPSSSLIDAVRTRLFADDVKLLTDSLSVRAAVVIPYDVTATLYIRSGPDPVMVKALAETSLRAMADRYKRLGGAIPRNAIDASLYVSNVDSVYVSLPKSDLSIKPHQAAYLRTSTLTVVVTDE